jgi:hypothetical protein
MMMSLKTRLERLEQRMRQQAAAAPLAFDWDAFRAEMTRKLAAMLEPDYQPGPPAPISDEGKRKRAELLDRLARLAGENQNQ